MWLVLHLFSNIAWKTRHWKTLVADQLSYSAGIRHYFPRNGIRQHCLPLPWPYITHHPILYLTPSLEPRLPPGMYPFDSPSVFKNQQIDPQPSML